MQVFQKWSKSLLYKARKISKVMQVSKNRWTSPRKEASLLEVKQVCLLEEHQVSLKWVKSPRNKASLQEEKLVQEEVCFLGRATS